jgi:hypothetical protein
MEPLTYWLNVTTLRIGWDEKRQIMGGSLIKLWNDIEGNFRTKRCMLICVDIKGDMNPNSPYRLWNKIMYCNACSWVHETDEVILTQPLKGMCNRRSEEVKKWNEVSR